MAGLLEDNPGLSTENATSSLGETFASSAVLKVN